MLARAGAVGQGEVLAGSIGDFAWQARALIRMALAEAGDTHQGRELARQAEAAASSLTDPIARGTGPIRRGESSGQGWSPEPRASRRPLHANV
jgi:hypothetical protein